MSVDAADPGGAGSGPGGAHPARPRVLAAASVTGPASRSGPAAASAPARGSSRASLEAVTGRGLAAGAAGPGRGRARALRVRGSVQDCP
jgi:hypothetical protein